MIMTIQKIERVKYVIVDSNNMLVSCEYITSLKKAKQELREIKQFFNL